MFAFSISELESGGQGRNDDLVKMARQIMEAGPRIGEIARRTGSHKETVRYRFHRYFLQQGFVIQANLDYQKLGLRRLIIFAKLDPRFEKQSLAIMSGLSEMCYLTGFAEEALGGLQIMQVTVPAELQDECSGIYRTLRDVGIFTKLQIMSFEEVRSVPMKPEHYDFVEGSWAYDWLGEEIKGVTLVPSGRAQLENYDMSDLFILKELNIDATRTLVSIARKLDTSNKTLEHHYREHVLGRGLIKNYKIVWLGTRYNAKTQKAESKRHKYMGVVLLATGTTDRQRAMLAANLNQLPFLWFEASDPNYYAELAIPVNSYPEFLRRVRTLSEATGTKPQLFIADQTRALRFTIAYSLYSQEKRKWQLNAADVITRFQSLMVNVNNPRSET